MTAGTWPQDALVLSHSVPPRSYWCDKAEKWPVNGTTDASVCRKYSVRMGYYPLRHCTYSKSTMIIWCCSPGRRMCGSRKKEGEIRVAQLMSIPLIHLGSLCFWSPQCESTGLGSQRRAAYIRVTVRFCVVFYPDSFSGPTYQPPSADASQLCPLMGIVLSYSEVTCSKLCFFPRETYSQWLDDKHLVCETKVKEGLRSKNSFLCSPYTLPLVITVANYVSKDGRNAAAGLKRKPGSGLEATGLT